MKLGKEIGGLTGRRSRLHHVGCAIVVALRRLRRGQRSNERKNRKNTSDNLAEIKEFPSDHVASLKKNLLFAWDLRVVRYALEFSFI
jgi:hypothetical protein